MKYLYIDNFRGFSKTFIPIKDVNFLVGENSTGKTSVLTLIKIISSPNFWIDQDFTYKDFGFTDYNDIVNINASDRSYFDIGLIDIDSQLDDNITETKAYLMTFVNNSGLPVISRFTYNLGTRQVRVKFGPKTVKYKYNEIDEFTDGDEFTKKIFMRWIEAHRTDKKGYIQLNADIISNPRENLFLVPSALEKIIGNKNKEKQQGFSGKIHIPIFKSEITWIAPIRSKPQRIYDVYKFDFSPEGEHIPYLIKKYFDSKSGAQQMMKHFENIGAKSGLFESVSVKTYGKENTSPFRLEIVLNRNLLNICSVGYGVSQSLPVIAELFLRHEGTWFAIQQPEVHLHPKAQAALGDLFYELCSEDKKKLFVETHSDYTIDRYRINYRKHIDNQKPDSQILFFERTAFGNKVYQIEILRDGELSPEQPEGYRSFFINEEMELLGI